MKFRLARHTTDLRPLIHFYCELLGLQVLGSFEQHNGYDGVFIGSEHAGWHLEFTVSATAPLHHPDDDDLLVFYANDKVHFAEIQTRFRQNGTATHPPRNPYWEQYGVLYKDPDGYGVMLAIAPGQ